MHYNNSVYFPTFKKFQHTTNTTMKNTSIILLLLLLCQQSTGQTMYVRPIIGTQTAYPVANIQKLTFSNGNMLVTNTTSSNGTFALSGNRYLNFTDLTLATTSKELVNNRFYVYPNPVTSVLHIPNLDPTQSISRLEIVSLQGRLLFEQNPLDTNTTQVDVATLPQGLYFCKITSNNKTQTIKFLKQ